MDQLEFPEKYVEQIGVKNKPYVSRFSSFNLEENYHRQAYSGTVIGVISELEHELSQPRREADRVELAMHPSRIMRGVMDFFIDERPDLDNAKHAFMERSVKLALHMTNKNGLKAIHQIERFKELIYRHNLHDLMVTPVLQIEDKPQWDSTSPFRSEKSANQIIDETKRKDMLFIPLGHGGIPAGIDVYSYYCAKSGSRDSILYPARFSRLKKGDIAPKLTEEEISFLRKNLEGRQPVLFDEDTMTGETLLRAYTHFNSILHMRNSPLKLLQVTNMKVNIQLGND